MISIFEADFLPTAAHVIFYGEKADDMPALNLPITKAKVMWIFWCAAISKPIHAPDHLAQAEPSVRKKTCSAQADRKTDAGCSEARFRLSRLAAAASKNKKQENLCHFGRNFCVKRSKKQQGRACLLKFFQQSPEICCIISL